MSSKTNNKKKKDAKNEDVGTYVSTFSMQDAATATAAPASKKATASKKQPQRKSRLDDDDDEDDNKSANKQQQQQPKAADASSKKKKESDNDEEEEDDDESAGAVPASADDAVQKAIDADRPIAQFMKDQADKEKIRLVKTGGVKINILPVRNCGLLRENQDDDPQKPVVKIVNRIEISNNYNFDQVAQILLSDPIACPAPRQNYRYVNVILTSDSSPIAQLLPYVYPLEKQNALEHWVFINSNLKRYVVVICIYVALCLTLMLLLLTTMQNAIQYFWLC